VTATRAMVEVGEIDDGIRDDAGTDGLIDAGPPEKGYASDVEPPPRGELAAITTRSER